MSGGQKVSLNNTEPFGHHNDVKHGKAIVCWDNRLCCWRAPGGDTIEHKHQALDLAVRINAVIKGFV